MIDLEVPKKFQPLVSQARAMAEEVFRPISRKYDLAEHDYPRELDPVSTMIDAMDAAGASSGAGARTTGGESDDAGQAEGDIAAVGSGRNKGKSKEIRNGSNLSSALSVMETCRGDVGLTLTIPRQGLGNAAIAAVANEEQKARYGSKWAAMAITEPDVGSDSGAIRTSATKDGDEYVLNGEKIFVTCGDRADLVVVWATLDKSLGKQAIKSFVVDKKNPGLKLVRLEHKLGIRASDTAAFSLENCRVPASDLLGDPEIKIEGGFGGAMQTFDNTRPLVAAMGVGLARACLDLTREILAKQGIKPDFDRPAITQSAAAAALIQAEADYQSSYLLTLRAAWMADNGRPNSMEASMAKAKAGRSCVNIALKCIEITGATGLGEGELLEKWARDSKILDIFEGTQQIQLLVVARRLLNLSSAQLK